MKAAKIILILLASLTALFLVIAIFLPSEFDVERSTEINKPAEEVFNMVVDFTQRNAWDPWFEKDTLVTTRVEGPLKDMDSAWIWESDSTSSGKIANGSIVIQDIEENEYIASEITFITMDKKDTSTAYVSWMFEDTTEDSTKTITTVTWQIIGNANYPIGRYIGLFTDGMLGPDLEKGLSNLKKIMEATEE